VGTSSSYSAPTTPEWRRAKNAASRYATGGGQGGGRLPSLPVARFIAALGGTTRAARDARVGRSVANGLLSFVRAASENGVNAALGESGLQDAVGLPADEALERLVDFLAADANTLDETAAREALIDVIRDLLGDLEDLADAFQNLDSDGVLEILNKFIAAYIFRRYAKALGDRFRANSLTGPAARRREEEIKRYIAAEVTIAIEQIDASSVNWQRDTEQLIDRCMRDAFRTLSDQDV
jgi:hypothetical protein